MEGARQGPEAVEEAREGDGGGGRHQAGVFEHDSGYGPHPWRRQDVCPATGSLQVDELTFCRRSNALPEYASASINYRIDFLSSVNATLSRLSSILAPTVKRFNLTFDAYGSHSDVENDVVRLQVIEGSEIEPAPITPTEGKAWELMAGTTRHVWKDAIVGPSGMVGEFGGSTAPGGQETLLLTIVEMPFLACSQHRHEGTGEALPRHPYSRADSPFVTAVLVAFDAQHLPLRSSLTRAHQGLPHGRRAVS